MDNGTSGIGQPQQPSPAIPQPMQPQQQVVSGQQAQNAAVDVFGTGTTISKNQDAFGANTGATTTEWENNTSNNGTFQASRSGMYAGSGSVTIQRKTFVDFLLGLAGAFIGIFLGCVLAVILFKLGLKEGIAGIAMVWLSLIGYSILGKGIDLKGVVICAVVSVVTVWFMHRACWAYDFMTVMNKEGAGIDYRFVYSNMDTFLDLFDFKDKYYEEIIGELAVTILVGFPLAKRWQSER